jgi:hypothetical protein
VLDYCANRLVSVGDVDVFAGRLSTLFGGCDTARVEKVIRQTARVVLRVWERARRSSTHCQSSSGHQGKARPSCCTG